MDRDKIQIADYDYPLPDERIAKFPLEDRDGSKLLIWNKGGISENLFRNINDVIPESSHLVFNNTKVIRARMIMHKPSGARIEVFCLEPHNPADHERAFSVKGRCEWKCIVGNSKKWKEGALVIPFELAGEKHELKAWRLAVEGNESIVRFEWDSDTTFGQLLEHLGRIPIPPYLGRDTEEIDNSRYQTVYSKIEGSVAAPTAGLHFSDKVISDLEVSGHSFGEVTLHVGAGTFLPVKSESVTDHHMHTEHFEITAATLGNLISNYGKITAVGTTSVRTIESLCALGQRIVTSGSPRNEETISQWELYDIPETTEGKDLLQNLLNYMESNGMVKLHASTQIMIMPGFKFRVANNIITNFHQPKSTLLLLVSAFTGESWREIYDYALANDFRFLSYGDSSILLG